MELFCERTQIGNKISKIYSTLGDKNCYGET